MRLHALAHEAAGGRWLATGGGGYQWYRVVPRAWTIYFGEMAGADLGDELPESWIEEAEREAGGSVPTRLSEAAPALPSQRGGVDGVSQSVKRAVFPFHGLTD